MKKLVAVSLFLVVGCAGRSFDHDHSDPSYHQGYRAPIPSGGVDMATVGVIASGIALAANRDYYKTEAITGQVLCKASDAIEIPCGNLDVVLYDMKGKEIACTQPRNGEFAFRVTKGSEYKVGVRAAGYVVGNRLPASSSLGDDVVIRLNRSGSEAPSTVPVPSIAPPAPEKAPAKRKK